MKCVLVLGILLLPPICPAAQVALPESAPAHARPTASAPIQGASPIPGIRVLLREEQFQELNALLEKYRAKAVGDVRCEDDLYAAYEAFDVNDAAMEPLFDRWVAAFPKSDQPYLARAKYLSGMGWSSRGTDWAAETSAIQFQTMRNYFDRAARDINTSLELQGKNIVPYCILVWMAAATGEVAEGEVAKALEFSPHSLRMRAVYLYSITPRWGGSYKKMSDFIKESQGHLAANPGLAVLQGFIAFDMGNLEGLNKNYSKADQLLTTAISFGESGTFFNERARIRQEQERFAEALQDADRAIGVWPHDGEFHYRRASILCDLKRFEEALKNAETANMLSPNDKETALLLKHLAFEFTQSGYQRQKKKDSEGAEADFRAAIEADPEAGRHYRRFFNATELAEKGDYDKALALLEQAQQTDPDDFNVYMLIDWILVKRGDWDGIIRSWDRFIERNPNHDRAYAERCGAYYHKGDMENAMRDAKKAASLGNETGRRFIATHGQ